MLTDFLRVSREGMTWAAELIVTGSRIGIMALAVAAVLF